MERTNERDRSEPESVVVVVLVADVNADVNVSAVIRWSHSEALLGLDCVIAATSFSSSLLWQQPTDRTIFMPLLQLVSFANPMSPQQPVSAASSPWSSSSPQSPLPSLPFQFVSASLFLLPAKRGAENVIRIENPDREERNSSRRHICLA